MNDSASRRALLERLLPIARAAGDVILNVYRTDFDVRGKSDASPVTEADEQAETVILAALATLTPDIPIVAEEAVAAGHVPVIGQRFWLVDPLDGTKEFISRNGEFTVNIALIEDGHPTLGVVLAPAFERLYAGAVGAGAFIEEGGERRHITVRNPPPEGLLVVASRSHGDAAALENFLKDYPVATIGTAGSSLKLCMIAAGTADLYPRLGRTMEWDIAAGHAVLAAAGGRITTLDGTPLRYGKTDFANPFFVASGFTS